MDNKQTNERTVIFYRVDVAKALRNSLTLEPEKFKEEVHYSKAHTRNKDWRKQMGALGLILKEDFEEGAYSEYGLKEARIGGSSKVQELTDNNAEMQKRIAELESQLSENKKVTKGKKNKMPKEENEEIGLNEPIETAEETTETNTTI